HPDYSINSEKNQKTRYQKRRRVTCAANKLLLVVVVLLLLLLLLLLLPFPFFFSECSFTVPRFFGRRQCFPKAWTKGWRRWFPKLRCSRGRTTSTPHVFQAPGWFPDEIDLPECAPTRTSHRLSSYSAEVR